jgi:serine phosphatase RsbU (regulator of sigma subunit)
MKYSRALTALILAAIALSTGISSCQWVSKFKSAQEYEDRFGKLSREGRNEELLQMLDSIEEQGIWDLERIYLYRGFTRNAMKQPLLAEQDFRKGIEVAKKGTGNPEILFSCYQNLARNLSWKMDIEGSMRLALEAIEIYKEWKEEGKISDMNVSTVAGLYQILGRAQARSHQYKEADKSFDDMWETIHSEMEDTPDSVLKKYNYDVFFGDQLLWTLEGLYVGEAYSYLPKWCDIADQYFKRMDKWFSDDSRDHYTTHSLFYKAIACATNGEKAKANDYYSQYKALTQAKDTTQYLINYFAILRRIGRYQEAAQYMDTYLANNDIDNNPIDFRLHNYAQSYLTFRYAGNDAKALEMGDKACAIADSTIWQIRIDNAAQLATMYDTQGKEMQIAEQKAELSQQRWIGTLVALILLTAFFIIYTLNRRKAQKRLAAAHQQLEVAHENLEKAHTELKTAYDQLEETTAAKERIESELRIARDIQMSMVPQEFPQYEGLDMYAVMNAAKEVGGDLYGYVLQGNMLHFCLGDVSGKGVPASLFMSQSARLFRTLAAEGLSPADIAFRMNKGLAENNKRMMFVTMFIGQLHLDTGRLDFCNCGHNPPVLDGQFLEMKYENHPLGLWEGDPFDGETIDDIRGRQLLIYTDGLNEAENGQKEQFGDDHLLELMADMQNLSSREVIDRLKEAVEQHRAGVEPNDDLTLMCVRFK